MKKCFYCKNELVLDFPPGRRDGCPFCGNDLHVCLNCMFYDTGAHHECREPIAEYVADKDRTNFCDMFQFRDSSEGKKVIETKEKALGALEGLFKK
jgi:hypothetical protein